MITGMIIGAVFALWLGLTTFFGSIFCFAKVKEEADKHRENAEAPKPPITKEKKKREKREESTINILICWTIISFFLLPPAFPVFLLALIFRLKEKKNKQKQ